MHLGRALADSTNDSKDKDENEDKRKQDQQKGDQQGKPHSRRRDGNGSKGSVSLGRDPLPMSMNQREAPLASVTLPMVDRSLLDCWMWVSWTHRLNLCPGMLLQDTERFQNRYRALKISNVE